MFFKFIPTLTISLAFFVHVSIGQGVSWKKHTNPQGAFSVEFPGEPKITESTNETPEGYSVKVRMYSVQDEGNVSYVLYNEMEPGVNILDESAYLNSVTDQILERFGREPKALEKIDFEGAPGKYFLVEFPDGVAEGKIVLRTNRAYFIVGFFPRARANDRKKFIDSFHFLPYTKMASVPFQSKEHFFKINFPSTPKVTTEQNEDGSPLYAYYGMDTQSGNNFSVAVDKYSVYSQFESDSAVLADRANGYILSADSIISNKDVIVDGRPAKDLIINQGTNNFKMRVRIFTNGNYSYTIFTFLPYNEIQLPHVNQFFDSFRFTAKVPGNLLTDKSALMLKDIESSDTTILKEVLPFIEVYDFRETHVPKIQELLQKKFDDDADTLRSRKISLLQALGKIRSRSSVAFIQRLFPALKGNAELEFTALDVLVKLSSPEANSVITQLLPQHSPVKGNIWKYSQLFSFMRLDSAESNDFLLKSLPLLKQQPYKTGLYSLLENSLRAKRLQFSEVAGFKQTILADLRSQFDTFTKDTIYQYLDDLTSLLGYDKLGKAELDILRKLSGSENQYLAIRANTALLRQGQKPNDNMVNKLAADMYFRKDLYHEFNDFALNKYFPKAYFRQDSIAISELYQYVADEYANPASMKVVHTEVLDYKGQSKRFFVISFTDPETGASYRGVAGPYATDKIEAFGELTGTIFDEEPGMSHHDYLLMYIDNF
ncbi:MAG TPA: hypothetical protein VGD65_06765 [Chryseosolibacter sp.]